MLDDLKASVLKSNAIEGRVSEIVVHGTAGSEIGRYRASEHVELLDNSDKLTSHEAAAQIAETLSIPNAGMTWDKVLPFLKSSCA